ncbi:MAG TPA: metallophosphoesterase [Gallionellaceae bacterium]|nr:metallophosphoesterase [Gallionellaceae bacterium]
MSTQQQYHDQLHALLSRRLAGAAGKMFSGDEIHKLAGALAGAVAELETHHQSASPHLQALLAGEQPEPWGGPGELAFMLYYLHHPSGQMRAAIDARPALKIAWEAMAEVAPASPFTPDDVEKLRARVTDGEKVLCTAWGEILSFETYERLDPDWAWPIMNYVLNFLPRWLDEKTTGLAPFVTADWTRPVPLAPGRDNKVRIALMGDWGTGPYTLTGMDSRDGPALEIMRALAALPEPPDYLIHLGDTYYSGTGAGRMPEHEERQNLLDVWKQYAAIARPGHCFALNGNHEMYGGLYGYQKVLADGLFSAQRGCSYFALEFGDWIIAGIDSSYFDTSVLYLDGSLGEESDPQYEFLRKIKALGKKVILLSHHNAISTDGASASPKLWNQVTGIVFPDYWYWGHWHLGVAFSEHAYSGPIKTRCVGHGAIPFANPPGMLACAGNIAWYAHTAPAAPGAFQPRAKNGYAVLTLTPSGITEEFYEVGTSKPVYSVSS